MHVWDDQNSHNRAQQRENGTSSPYRSPTWQHMAEGGGQYWRLANMDMLATCTRPIRGLLVGNSILSTPTMITLLYGGEHCHLWGWDLVPDCGDTRRPLAAASHSNMLQHWGGFQWSQALFLQRWSRCFTPRNLAPLRNKSMQDVANHMVVKGGSFKNNKLRKCMDVKQLFLGWAFASFFVFIL